MEVEPRDAEAAAVHILTTGIPDTEHSRTSLPLRRLAGRDWRRTKVLTTTLCTIAAELQVGILVVTLQGVKRYASKPTRSRSKISFKKRSPCPVSCALDILGDKWTLLVIRDLMNNKTLYNEMVQSPENIPTSILADRLRRLEHAGVIEKEPYQDNPVRYAYRLTPAGTALHPVLKEIAIWAREHVAAASVPEEFLRRRLG